MPLDTNKYRSAGRDQNLSSAVGACQRSFRSLINLTTKFHIFIGTRVSGQKRELGFIRVHNVTPVGLAGAVLCTLLLFIGGSTFGAEHKKDAARVAESIQQRLESELFALDPDIQAHFALRMYRMTGDERYLPPIVYNLLVTLENLRRDLSQAHDSSYVAGRCSEMRSNLNPKTRKGRIRAEMFERAGAVQFYLNLLHAANDFAELGVKDTEPFRGPFQVSLSECRPAEIESFLLDSKVIGAYAPQAVNYVYYLYDLGLADIRQAYTETFRTTYPDRADRDMLQDDYADKVYGLTHFITAASRYYQQSVDSTEFAWILDYFEKNLDRIIDDTREDVVAEVGLCFLLTGRENNPAVVACRKRMIDRFDSGEGLIPSTTGRTDLAQSEHRNIIAYMLLTWPDRLHSGPNLPESRFFREVLAHSKNGGE